MSEHPPSAPPPLPYAPAPRRGMHPLLGGVLGILTSAVIGFVAAFVGGLFVFTLDGPRPKNGMLYACLAVGVSLVIVAGIGYATRRHSGYRVGLIIGVGLSLLWTGLCFSSM